jgi:hypothetical protein
METLTFSKQNYTGEDATIKVTKAGVFTVHGDRFRVVVTTVKDEDPNLCGERAAVWYEGPMAKRERPIFTGFKFQDDKTWTFTQGDYTRDHENVYVAAARLLYLVW